MWMVVFGAGASYDSVTPDRWKDRVGRDLQPPLTINLFDQRAVHVAAWKRYEACAPLINELWHVARAAAVEGSQSLPVEEYLEELVTNHGDTPELKRQLMALRFYLHEVIAGTVRAWVEEHGANTNYSTLLEWLRRMLKENERLALVTFNYDPLLDQARNTVFGPSQASTGPSTDPKYDDDFMDSYLSGRSILIRPHGSVDWAHLANRSRTEPSVLIAEADSYSLKPGWIRPWKGAQRPEAEVPAIAIPTRGKLDFECPPEHITALTRLLPEVTHVVTIGWRAQEEAFLDLCREHMRPPVRVMVVSANGGEADAVAKHLDLELSPLFPTVQGSRVKGFSNLILAGWRELEVFGKS